MYTNIRTGPALTHISHLLRQEAGRTFHHYDTQALIEAIELVFTNNILQFGDTYWQQISGTGMGIAPPPMGHHLLRHSRKQDHSTLDLKCPPVPSVHRRHYRHLGM
eukprot:CCRYP_019354-RB/>CCRYP_019354-RB protein AED:0.41 eAED:0.41 QI:0/-1/0/1/-1/0/1/0/105